MADFTVPRITEKRYDLIPPQLFTVDGTNTGVITILNTYSFKVGQLVTLKSNTQSSLKVKIQRVISETQLIVININESVTTKNKLDISAFLLADAATIELPEDKRPVIDLHEIQRQVYEEEPTVALRTHSVDWLGRPYDKTNPLQVQLSDGSIDIGTVNAELEVQLSHKDNDPDAGDVHDSVRIGDGTDQLEINPDGSINIINNSYDKIFALLVNANFLKLGNYDKVIPTFVGNITTINYYESGAHIAKAEIRYVNNIDWDMTLEAYINNDNGSILEDDDDNPLILD